MLRHQPRPFRAPAAPAVAAFEALEDRRLFTTYTVTNVNDAGAGSLRQAILDANNHGGADVIAFDIAGPGVKTIAVQSELPQITDTVTIDGTTQDGYTNKPLIEIAGGDAGGDSDGITVFNTGATIRGLCINSFPNRGVAVFAGLHTVRVEGNFIGTDPTGMSARPNRLGGVYMAAGTGIVGGDDPGDRNVISGNGTSNVSTTASTGVTLQSSGQQVIGNYIGVAADGVTPLGNKNFGVYITGGGDDNLVRDNVIAHNGSTGVLVPSHGTQNEITRNSIFSNAGLGIDLNASTSSKLIDGVTANDAGDNDAGGNNLVNAPVLAKVTNGLETIRIQGTFNSQANRDYRLEFFSSRFSDPTGFGEGQTYLGSAEVETDEDGNATIDVTLDKSVLRSLAITATATDLVTDDTSEFSRAIGGLTLQGTSGNDVITISKSGDTISYVLNGVTKTYAASLFNAITIDAGNGNDTVTVGAGINGAYVSGGGGKDVLRGGAGKDNLVGGAQADLIYGGGGDDRLNGGGGNDVIHGELGNDRLYGAEGNDTMIGAAGVDRLFGDLGNDSLIGGGSNDKLYGEEGNDTLVGNDGNDLLDGGTGADNLVGGDGNDRFLIADNVIDTANGGDGTDEADADPTDLLTSVEQLI